MENELRRLRILFANALALTLASCGDSSDSTTTAVDCTQACQCYTRPPDEVVRKPYVPKCAAATDAGDTGSDASDASDVLCEEDYYSSCDRICGPSAQRFTSCRPVQTETGVITEIECIYSSPPCGRATEGQPAIDRPRDVPSWLLTAAALEAASVEAFTRLAAELSFHRAPRALVREARRAARDEVRHARVMAAFAERRGLKPKPTPPVVLPLRSLERIALENAIEGCVRETFGALLATHQARAARDRSLRAAFARIAADETRHAALAHAIHRWALRRLPRDTRARIEAARAAAFAALADELTIAPSADMRDTLGLPDAALSRAMLDVLQPGGPTSASNANNAAVRFAAA